MCPAEWNKFSLSEVTEIIGGGTPKTSIPDYWDGDIPWISVVDFGNGRKYIWETEKQITNIGLQNSSTKILKSGQIVISARGTVGEIGVVTKDMAFNQSCYGLNANDMTTNEFLYYLLKFNLNQVKKKTHGAVFETITRETFDQIQVLLPPLPEQRAIADVLSALDDKIDLNRRMNQTLESLAQAIFKHMFLDNPEREIWEVGSLGDDFNLTMGQSPPGSTYNEIGTGLPFFQGRADFGLRYPSNRVYCTAPTRFADTGDTLVCVRAPVGDVNVAFEKCAIGRGLAAIRHKSGSRSYTFYMMQFLEPEFKNFELEGTVFGSINKDSFLSLKIPLPPHNLIEKFEEICYPVDQKIELNNRESRNLAELRDTLLPKLMSGQVRVKI